MTTSRTPWEQIPKTAKLEDLYASLMKLLTNAAIYGDTKPLVIAYRGALIRIGNRIYRERRS